jgi:hypothetical protein
LYAQGQKETAMDTYWCSSGPQVLGCRFYQFVLVNKLTAGATFYAVCYLFNNRIPSAAAAAAAAAAVFIISAVSTGSFNSRLPRAADSL